MAEQVKHLDLLYIQEYHQQAQLLIQVQEAAAEVLLQAAISWAQVPVVAAPASSSSNINKSMMLLPLGYFKAQEHGFVQKALMR